MEKNDIFRSLKIGAVASLSTFLLTAEEGNAQNLKNEKGEITFSRTETRTDQNMPNGFRRDQVVGIENGQEKTVASLFWFEDGKTQAHFFSKEKHQNDFIPEINYEKIDDELEKKGEESVIAFAGAYESGLQKGTIEGVAIENGQDVGSQTYSKSGFVYIMPGGSMELYRFRDEQKGAIDVASADKLVERAKKEKGSLFQQIPAIWDGVERLNSTNQQKFEWRAICQTKDGKKFVLNCSEKITLRDFLIFALNIKDEQGNQLVDDLMLTDTGVYSYGIFRDKDQIKDESQFKAHTMVDENFADNKTGYTNVVVIGTKD